MIFLEKLWWRDYSEDFEERGRPKIINYNFFMIPKEGHNHM